MKNRIKYLSLFILLAIGINAQMGKYFEIDTTYLKKCNHASINKIIEADRRYDSVIAMLQRLKEKTERKK